MSGKLLIWGYGRVGSAMTKQIMLQRNQNEGVVSLFESVLVISSKEDELCTHGLDWVVKKDFIANVRSFIGPGDVVVLTVSDSQISECASLIDIPGVTVVHCSGATPMANLECAESAVFYPLQTFATGAEIDWSTLPVFTETNGDSGYQVLQRIAETLGVRQSRELSFSVRQYLHMAGVFANNFTVAMAGIAHDILTENDMPSSLIQPILKQTAMNLGSENPWEKLTGPAKRGDLKTQANHLELLENNEALKALYTLMSGYIQAKNNKA